MMERPILFSAPMVRAILNGSKSQTRRVIKFPPIWRQRGDFDDNGWPGWVDDHGGWVRARCPYGGVGDRLWVRETCSAIERNDGLDCVRYAADQAERAIENTADAATAWLALYCYRKKRGATVPPIHMPRCASRITLEVTGVRVERLGEISESDARAEGVATRTEENIRKWGYDQSIRMAFADLWDSVHGPGAWWEANPWVWAISFVRVTP